MNNKTALLLSFCCYAVSFFLPAFFTGETHKGYEVAVKGYQVAVMGAISFMEGGIFKFIIWLANPIYLISVIMGLSGNRKAFLVAFVAFGLSLLFSICRNILSTENESADKIISLSIGYYLWLLAIGFWAVYLYFTRNRVSYN